MAVEDISIVPPKYSDNSSAIDVLDIEEDIKVTNLQSQVPDKNTLNRLRRMSTGISFLKRSNTIEKNEDEQLSIRLTEISKNINFLSTRSTPKPLIKDVSKETRFILRCVQLSSAFIAFGNIAVCATATNDGFYQDLSSSGLSIMILVSITSMFVSSSCLVVYTQPAFLGIPPHRHKRFSRIEVVVDLLFIAFWLAASTAMAFYNAPTIINDKNIQLFGVIKLPCWPISFTFGYITSLLHGATFILGIRDIWFYGWYFKVDFGAPVFQAARGNWKED